MRKGLRWKNMIKGIMLHTQFNFQIVHKFELENGD